MARIPESGETLALLRTLPRSILQFLCTGIQYAHASSPNKWGLTVYPQALRLNVGFCEVLTVGGDSLRILIQRTNLPAALPKTVTAERGPDKRGFYPVGAPGSLLVEFSFPLQPSRLTQALGDLKTGFIENVRVAGQRGRGRGIPQGHSNLAVSLVAAAANHALPFPLYAVSTASANRTDDLIVVEGQIEETLVRRRRRNRGLIDLKLRQAQRSNGRITCEVCGMDPVERYGPNASQLCEVHHRTALAAAEISVKTGLADLAILCPNCHRAIHTMVPLPTVENFRRALHQSERD